MSSVFSIAISGLNDATLRIANAASNIVNASSTGKLSSTAGEASTGFQPQDVITLSSSVGNNPLGVTSQLTPRNPASVTTYDPTSANANAQGLVAAPNVDLNAELIGAKEAQVTYGANVKVIEIQQKMEQALLDIKT